MCTAARPESSRARSGRLAIELPLILLLSLAATLWGLRWISGDAGLLRVEANQVAVVGDALDGEARIVATPGYITYLPFWQRVEVLDKSPVEYVMGDEEDGDSAKLIVRSPDGSNFWFNSVRVQYALNPARAAWVLEDSGPGKAFTSRALDAYTRAVLRDEFGRFTPEEIVVPDNRHAATTRSRRRLQELLDRHGLTVLDVSVSKPSFARAYETTLERRQTAEQDLERSIRKTELARAGRVRRLELTEREAETERVLLQHELELERAQAQRQAERHLAQAEEESRASLSQATTEFEAQKALAAARMEQSEARVAGLRALAEAVEAQGPLAVREVLVSRLDEIGIVLEPFSETGIGQPAVPASPATDSTITKASR